MTNRCQCGRKKDTLANKCKGCYNAEIRSQRPKATVKACSETRECIVCFVEFSAARGSRRCTYCDNYRKSHPGLLPGYHRALERCDDQDRRWRIQAEINRLSALHPQEVAYQTKQDKEIAELIAAMTPIIRTDPMPSGTTKDGYPKHQTTRTGWRCQRCRAACVTRKCTRCELVIRGYASE